MSNFLAVASVTMTLCKLLQEAINLDSNLGVTVTAVRPDGLTSAGNDIFANVFLYRVNTNKSWRNEDLPTRRAGGQVIQSPRVALDLDYLLTFSGNEKTLDSQRMLGSVMRTLHGRPMLSRRLIEKTTQDEQYGWLAESDLHHELELVKFTPLQFTLEELSKIWSVFFQTPYSLSVGYRATVVLIESDGTPVPALPLNGRHISALPFGNPVVSRIVPAAGVPGPMMEGEVLTVEGERLLGEITRVRIAGAEMPILEGSEKRISFRLSHQSLRAGALGLQVIHFNRMEDGREVPAGESNLLPMVLCPKITGPAVLAGRSQHPDTGLWSALVTLPLSPPVRKGQRVRLLLNELVDEAPAAYGFAAPPAPKVATEVTIPVTGVKGGEYLLRVAVDGAESPLDRESDPASPDFGRFKAPILAIGIPSESGAATTP